MVSCQVVYNIPVSTKDDVHCFLKENMVILKHIPEGKSNSIYSNLWSARKEYLLYKVPFFSFRAPILILKNSKLRDTSFL